MNTADLLRAWGQAANNARDAKALYEATRDDPTSRPEDVTVAFMLFKEAAQACRQAEQTYRRSMNALRRQFNRSMGW